MIHWCLFLNDGWNMIIDSFLKMSEVGWFIQLKSWWYDWSGCEKVYVPWYLTKYSFSFSLSMNKSGKNSSHAWHATRNSIDRLFDHTGGTYSTHSVSSNPPKRLLRKSSVASSHFNFLAACIQRILKKVLGNSFDLRNSHFCRSVKSVENQTSDRSFGWGPIHFLVSDWNYRRIAGLFFRPCCLGVSQNSLSPQKKSEYGWFYMGVSLNGGTPKSSNLIGFSNINHPFWGTPIFENTHIDKKFLVGSYGVPNFETYPIHVIAQRCIVGWSLLHLRTPILLGQGIFGLKVAKPRKPRAPVKEGMKIGAKNLCGDWWVKSRHLTNSDKVLGQCIGRQCIGSRISTFETCQNRRGGNGYLLE